MVIFIIIFVEKGKREKIYFKITKKNSFLQETLHRMIYDECIHTHTHMVEEQVSTKGCCILYAFMIGGLCSN